MKIAEALRKRPLQITVGAVAVVITAVLLSQTSAHGTDTTPPPGAAPTEGPIPSGVNSPSVPPGYTGLNDPALKACMQAHQICNSAAYKQDFGSETETAPIPQGAALMARASAEAVAIGSSTITSPTYSAMMSGVQADAKFSIGRPLSYDSSRPVWVVAVHAHVATDGGPAAAGKAKDAFSVVIDAASGRVTDMCIGCAWLTQGS